MNIFYKFLKNRDGVTSIEYGILAAGLAVAIAVIVADDGPLITAITNLFESMQESIVPPGDGGEGGG